MHLKYKIQRQIKKFQHLVMIVCKLFLYQVMKKKMGHCVAMKMKREEMKVKKIMLIRSREVLGKISRSTRKARQMVAKMVMWMIYLQVKQVMMSLLIMKDSMKKEQRLIRLKVINNILIAQMLIVEQLMMMSQRVRYIIAKIYKSKIQRSIMILTVLFLVES